MPATGLDPDRSALLPEDAGAPKPIAEANDAFSAALDRFYETREAMHEADRAVQGAKPVDAPSVRPAFTAAEHEHDLARHEAGEAQRVLAAAVVEHREEWIKQLREERIALLDAITERLHEQRQRFEALRALDHRAEQISKAVDNRYGGRTIRQLGGTGAIRWERAAEKERKAAASTGTSRLTVKRDVAHLLAALEIEARGDVKPEFRTGRGRRKQQQMEPRPTAVVGY